MAGVLWLSVFALLFLLSFLFSISTPLNNPHHILYSFKDIQGLAFLATYQLIDNLLLHIYRQLTLFSWGASEIIACVLLIWFCYDREEA